MHTTLAWNAAMTRRRRLRDDRWSASFSLTVIAGNVRTPVPVEVSDTELESSLADLSGRAQFRWRFEGKPRSRSVKLEAGTGEVVAFRNLLRVAFAEDWDLNGSTPTPPVLGLPSETAHHRRCCARRSADR